MDFRYATIVLLGLCLALPLAALGQTADPAKGVDYRIVVDCPGAAFLTNECPLRVIDGADALGDPSLAVDPFNPNNLILASLHGTGDHFDAPSPKSRGGQVFTTHTSTNHGVSWNDRPFNPPAAVSRDAFGEHPQVTVTPFGQAFIGSLYSVPGNPEGRFDYVIAAQKFKSLSDINNNQDTSGDFNAQFLGAVNPGSRINQMWYSFNPLTDNMTMVWHESATKFSAPPAGVPRIANSMDAVIPLFAKVPALGLGLDAQPNGSGAQSLISLVWTTADARSSYEGWEHQIAPCQRATNPVISEGYLYIGCQVAKDQGVFSWNPAAEPGDVEIFRLDPDGGEPEYLGPASIKGGAPKLGVRSDGRMALATAGIGPDGNLVLDTAYGAYSNSTGRVHWGPVHHYGKQFPAIGSQFDLVEANVQDVTYREYSGVVHMIIKQVIERNTGSAGVLEPTIRKSIVAVDEVYGYLDDHHFDIGALVNRTQDQQLLTQSDGVFNDLTDDFLQLHAAPYRYNDRNLGPTYQREFFAIGDYGVILFGELIEITDLRFAPAIPPPPPPPPPVPAAAAATLQAVAPAAALTASGLLARNFATAKRKNTVKADKKR